MADITGATFNFNKTVTEDEPASTPYKPIDGAKVETKTAEEKKGKQNLKDIINLSIVQQTVKTAINSAIRNVGVQSFRHKSAHFNQLQERLYQAFLWLLLILMRLLLCLHVRE